MRKNQAVSLLSKAHTEKNGYDNINVELPEMAVNTYDNVILEWYISATPVLTQNEINKTEPPFYTVLKSLRHSPSLQKTLDLL